MAESDLEQWWDGEAAVELEAILTTNDPPKLDEIQIAQRRDAALLRALSTPHKKQADMKMGRGKKGDPHKGDAKPIPPKSS